MFKTYNQCNTTQTQTNEINWESAKTVKDLLILGHKTIENVNNYYNKIYLHKVIEQFDSHEISQADIENKELIKIIESSFITFYDAINSYAENDGDNPHYVKGDLAEVLASIAATNNVHDASWHAKLLLYKNGLWFTDEGQLLLINYEDPAIHEQAIDNLSKRLLETLTVEELTLFIKHPEDVSVALTKENIV